MIGRLLRSERAVTAVEFALASPVIFAVVLGGLEMGHTMYVKAVLDGEVQKAARDLSLEDAASQTRRDAIIARARSDVRQVINTADVQFVTTAYHDYRNANGSGEEYNDRNHNGRCDNNEVYIDSNSNNRWDSDPGVDGAGGAKDVMLLTATVTYPRMPLSRIWADSSTVRMTSTTLLRNQPSSEQATPVERNCP